MWIPVTLQGDVEYQGLPNIFLSLLVIKMVAALNTTQQPNCPFLKMPTIANFSWQILSEALINCHRTSSEAGTPLQLQVFISGRNRLENPGAKSLAAAFEVGDLWNQFSWCCGRGRGKCLSCLIPTFWGILFSGWPVREENLICKK